MPRLLRSVRPLPRLPGRADAPLDVRIADDGTVAAVAPALEVRPDDEVVDLTGAFLSPGWIDLHVHVYHGGTDISVRPEEAGLGRGVTTLLDCGSAGEANFAGFREFVIDRAAERIFALLNIGSIGLVACNRVSELGTGARSVDLGRALEVVERNRDVIRGVKVRASQLVTGDWGIAPVGLAKKLARMCGLPLVVHVGEGPPLLEEILALLDAGDVVTHAYHGKPGGRLSDDGVALRAVREATARGVLLDVGHGAASFSFGVLERALELGLGPHVISTDLHRRNIDAKVVDLATTLSKVVAAGLDLEEAIRAVTLAPARWLGLDVADDWLRPGAAVDLTLFEVVDVDLLVRDAEGEARRLRRFIAPRYALLGRRFTAASSRSLDGSPGEGTAGRPGSGAGARTPMG